MGKSFHLIRLEPRGISSQYTGVSVSTRLFSLSISRTCMVFFCKQFPRSGQDRVITREGGRIVHEGTGAIRQAREAPNQLDHLIPESNDIYWSPDLFNRRGREPLQDTVHSLRISVLLIVSSRSTSISRSEFTKPLYSVLSFTGHPSRWTR